MNQNLKTNKIIEICFCHKCNKDKGNNSTKKANSSFKLNTAQIKNTKIKTKYKTQNNIKHA